MTSRRGKAQRVAYWTRERVILGLRRFYEDFGYMPTSTNEYQSRRRFTGRTRDGKLSLQAWHQKYPSIYGVAKYFKTLREAWTAAGFNIDKGNEEWSPMEDWFIVETCGILPREEVANYIRRSVPAVRRRLYDLGRITAHTRWGLTLSRAAHEIGIAEYILRRYLEHGTIPYFRGHFLIYLNPADLLKIVEIDWSKPSPAFRETVRRALIQRALKILKFGPDWRRHEIYTFQKKEGLFTKRITGPRNPSLISHPPPPPPNDLAVGDWVRMSEHNDLGVAGRIGVIRAIHYSPHNHPRRDGSKRKCWVARVEFPRLRRSKVGNDQRINYSVPLDQFERAERPTIEPKPLSMHPEAVRGRRRFKHDTPRAGARLQKIASQIS